MGDVVGWGYVLLINGQLDLMSSPTSMLLLLFLKISGVYKLLKKLFWLLYFDSRLILG
jgi:hypothetical protein